MKKPSNIIFAPAMRTATILTTITLFIGQSVHSAVGTWSGPANGVWDTTATNWTDVTGTPWDAINGPNNTSIFNTGSLAATVTGTVHTNGISFTTAGALSGGTITLGGTTPGITTTADATISSIIDGSAGLVKTGAGVLALTSANTYSGTTQLNAGALQAAAGTGLPATSYLSFNGGVLETSGTFTRALGTSGNTVGWVGSTGGGLGGGFSAKGGDLTVNFGGAAAKVSFSGAGGAAPSGTFQFGSNTGDSKVVVLNPIGLNGAGRIIGVTAGIGGAAATSAEITGVIDGANTTGGLTKTGNGTLILSAANTWASRTILSGGVVVANVAQTGVTSGPLGAGNVTGINAGGELRFNGGTLQFSTASAAWDPSNRIAATASGTGAVSIHTGDQNITFATALTASQTKGLAKLGTGSLTLSAANAYTGATAVSEGTLSVTGSLGNTAVDVATGATLSGNGNFGGAVTIQSTARHSLAVAATSGTQDTSNITGLLTLVSGNILDLTFSSPPAAGVYVLATAAGTISGTPTTVNYNGITGSVAVNGTNLELTVTSVAGYASWVGGFGLLPADKDPTDDPDNDDMDNLLEYALNGNPSISDPAVLPDLNTSGATFVFSYDRLDLSLTDTTQTFQYGSDLSGWTNVVVSAGGGPVGAATITVTPGSPADGISISIPKTEAGATGKLFGRLKVTQP